MAEVLTLADRRPYGVRMNGERGSRATVAVARLLAVVACALSATAVALPLVGGFGYLAQLTDSPEVAVGASFSVTGALLVGRRASRSMGWLLLAVGFSAALYACSISWTAYVLGGEASSSPPPDAVLAPWTAWVSGWAWFPSWLLLSTLLPQVVPYGRPLPGAIWRIPAWTAGVFCLLGMLAFMLAPGPVSIFEAIDNPVAAPELYAAVEPVEALLDVGVLVLLGVSLVSLVVRLLRADGVERRQVGWVGYAVVLVVAVVLLAPSVWLNLVVLLVPAGIAVAALRYRLYDLDLLVNRTLVAAMLLTGAAVVYVALVAWVGALVGTSGGVVPFAAAFAVALAFHPARIRVQRLVDRLFHGRRGDPYRLLRDLDRTLRDAGSPREALVAATAVVRDGLRLPGTGIHVDLPGGGVFSHEEGQLTEAPAVIPLELHDRAVGSLLVAPRDARRPVLADADDRVLHALAGPLASAAYALRLTGDLAQSHRMLLEAREDERRRLRRDLHDGLGPQLAGIVMGLDVVGSSLSRGETDHAAELARRTTDQARTAVADVRRLVRGLRPPALDELGLVGALESLVATTSPGGAAVTVRAQGDLTDLPAAVEVAAYRIVAEAVTNARRHADARRVEVVLDGTSEVLRVHVCDDGAGIAPGTPSGVGSVSMRERATELGGWCRVSSSTRGTTVRLELPRRPSAVEA
ncbi:sensor histidine kinase [Nocardioides coralli]|uniref:sensor histidine kinase n=1 Tax=Nocardioides coralli TaxID=2872154 RepID=UPI001CA45CD7|nr:histidine kinase [Nocardioides coralli]QZY27874.1 hypothetical protein K6T13_10195 [Nocardioides coralli]